MGWTGSGGFRVADRTTIDTTLSDAVIIHADTDTVESDAKGAWAAHSVPTADAVTSDTMAQTIGNKNDTHSRTSLYAKNHTLLEHNHSAAKVYPTMADGVLITSSDVDWTGLGDFAEIIPKDTITSDFDLHFVNVEAVSATAIYELVLYSSDASAETEVARVRFPKTTNQDGPQSVPVQTRLMSGSSQIKAKLASNNAAADTATVSLFYHEY